MRQQQIGAILTFEFVADDAAGHRSRNRQHARAQIAQELTVLHAIDRGFDRFLVLDHEGLALGRQTPRTQAQDLAAIVEVGAYDTPRLAARPQDAQGTALQGADSAVGEDGHDGVVIQHDRVGFLVVSRQRGRDLRAQPIRHVRSRAHGCQVQHGQRCERTEQHAPDRRVRHDSFLSDSPIRSSWPWQARGQPAAHRQREPAERNRAADRSTSSGESRSAAPDVCAGATRRPALRSSWCR